VKAPPLRFWIAQVAGWGGYALILWLSSLALLPDVPAALAHLRMKGAMASGGFLASLGLWVLYERLLAKKARLVVLVAAAVVASLSFGVFDALFVKLLLEPQTPLDGALLKGASNYGITLLAWSALYLAFTYGRQLEEERERALRATALASEARLTMLRYQVHPHFLFNALNSIRALIDEDPRRAREMVTELADFFRYSLVHGRDGDATLGEELAAIRSYLAIQKIRFEDRLEVSFDVPADAEAARLPGFLVHPLVENAVKHGMETSAMPLRLSVSARRAEAGLSVEVANTGRYRDGCPNGDGTGTGLANVRERLEQLYPGRHTLKVAEDGGWVRARILVPGDSPGPPVA